MLAGGWSHRNAQSSIGLPASSEPRGLRFDSSCRIYYAAAYFTVQSIPPFLYRSEHPTLGLLIGQSRPKPTPPHYACVSGNGLLLFAYIACVITPPHYVWVEMGCCYLLILLVASTLKFMQMTRFDGPLLSANTSCSHLKILKKLAKIHADDSI
jgi:hypothetical protein